MFEAREAFWGQLADRYRLEKLIGRGGMGSVYLAYELKHDRHVAIKVLVPELCNAVSSDRFLRELKIAAGLQHPHILPVYDSGEAAGALYYVMPYVPGKTVRERLSREGQLPIDEAVRIAREVGSALAYAHNLGIVHRDIKPENILLSEGYAVVADFGIARALSQAGSSELTSRGVTLGTPAYMSPEQLGPEARVDGRCDLYSLGCVLYEMLAGQPPFSGVSAHAVLARHLADPAPSLRTVRTSVPVPVENAIMRALEKVPADRFASGEEFVRALGPQTGPGWTDVPASTGVTDRAPVSLFSELRRRRVYRTALLYGSVVFAVLQGAQPTAEALGLPGWLARGAVIAVFLGFPVVLLLSWSYDLTLRGLQRTAVLDLGPRVAPKTLLPLLDSNSARPWIQDRFRLTFLLACIFVVNWIETLAEAHLAPTLPFLARFREQTARSAHWFEGYLTFANHDVTNNFAVIGYSSAYYFALPLLLLTVGLALSRRTALRPYRVFTLSLVINYLASLPFFLLFPVPERWSYADAGAMLLSDKWSPHLIEAIRPISALDNCFPSSHVSITTILVLLGFLFQLRLRWAALWTGLIVICSTYALGIHWLTDIAAGVALGCLSVSLALRLEADLPSRIGPSEPSARRLQSKLVPATLGPAEPLERV